MQVTAWKRQSLGLASVVGLALSSPLIAQTDTAPATTVRVGLVVHKTVSQFQVAQGTVHAVRRDYLTFERAGHITYLHNTDDNQAVREGDTVTGPTADDPEGLLLAELDNTEAEAALKVAQAEFASAKVRVDSAEKTLERTTTLVERGSATKVKLDTDQAAYDSALAARDAAAARVLQARTHLRTGQLRAPFDGVVAFINIREGQYVTPQQFDSSNESSAARTAPIVIIDPDDYEISVNLPVFEAEDVKKDQRAFVVSQELLAHYQQYGDEAIATSNLSEEEILSNVRQVTRVTSVSPAVDPADRSVRVRLKLANEDGALRDGSFVNVWIETGREDNALVVPFSAVQAKGDRLFVYVLNDDNTVSRRAVELGLFDFDGVQITKGVEAGETVVTVGKARLQDGAKVTPVKDEGEDQ